MFKIEIIDNLQQILDNLKNIIMDLNDSVLELTNMIDLGEFIPDSLNETIKERLNQISNKQKEFSDQYIALDMGDFPKKMGDVYEILEQCKQKSESARKYLDAVKFFMTLHSDDEKVQELLEQRKRALETLDFETMNELERKETAQSYVWLFDAFYETDPVRKFSLMYKLASSFEEQIAMGVQFGTLKTVENDVLERENIGTEIKEKMKGKMEENLEIEAELSDETGHDDEKIISEVTLDNTEEDESNIWEAMGIDKPEQIMIKEDRSLLDVQMSSKVSVKFAVKEFKRDIKNQESAQKMDCLIDAFERCGYSKESIAIWNKQDLGYYDWATEKLFQLGYLKRYVVKGYGEFYILSPRGEKAFILKDALEFINSYSGRKKYIGVGGEHIDTTNAALTRLLFYSTFAKIKKINKEYAFLSKTRCIGTEFFFLEFPEVIQDKKVVFFGIISENPQQFQEAYENFKKRSEDTAQYVVININSKLAYETAKWVANVLNGAMSVWYCGYSDNEIFDLATKEMVDLEVIKETNAEEKADTDIEKEGKTNVDPVNEQTHQDTIEGEYQGVKLCKLVEELTADAGESEIKIAAAEVAVTLEEVSEKEDVESEIKTSVVTMRPFSESEKSRYNKIYQEMLAANKFYGATAYVKVLSKDIPYYDAVYRQLAYALNDPLCGCSYSSDTIFNIYYNNENPISDHYVVAAAMRNYFLDQFSYDYSLQQLQAMLSGNNVLQKEPVLDKIVYTLQKFKTDNHSGIDRYADYREKERAYWEIRLEETRREAKDYYDNYSVGNFKETASHKRFIETAKILLGQGSDLSEYLQVVMNDDRDMVDLLKEFLAVDYVKDHAEICEENIEPAKIEVVLDRYWELAAHNMRSVKKSSDLMSSLRMNLFKRVHKVVCVLCNYVFLIKSEITSKDDPALREYKKIRKLLLEDISEEIEKLSGSDSVSLAEMAGNAVLIQTLRELKARLEGDYKEGNYKYFYVDFLKSDKVLLDDDFLPVLDDVLELPNFSIENRIIQHCQAREAEWGARLSEIFSGGDDYGSAELILKYLTVQNIILQDVDIQSFSVAKAIVFPQKDMENKRSEFIEDIELAQSYGQIDNTVENNKEIIIQIMETWFLWANETKNYGFFAKILEEFKAKIREDARIRAVELEESLNVYLEKNSCLDKDELIYSVVAQIKDRIKQQNYAAAEDLLNRLITNDLDSDLDFELHQTDYLSEFLDEYELNYRKTANSRTTLKSLVSTSKINKDTKGANRLLENWPRGAGVGEVILRGLLTALGFNCDTVKAELPIQGKIESYLVTLKRPQNGRKNNYKHPISAFGSEAEDKGFRVACIFGKADALRLIDIFKEIGNAKNTLVLLDYALTLADRRTLARKTKTDLSGKIFAVIDRVVLVYLAKHYTETAINRILMYVVMPFASYQPYIDKSADVMPQEIFIGRKHELEKIESPTGVNIVYGGRQLGKTALLRMAKKDIDMDENGDRAIIVNAWRKDYRETAKAISVALYDEKILKKENITEDWNELARDIKNRLRDESDPIPYFLLMIDEADAFIESCEIVGYQPFDALKDIQSIGSSRFKFVVAGLRNIVRFKRMTALGNNSVLTHLDSLTVKPFKSMEARELLEVPLSYLGFRFPKDNETEVLISTIFGTTNYFPGLIQLYCTKLIEAMKHDYAGYSESETPPYYVQKEHIKKVLAEQALQQDIREKFFITLKVGEDDYYYIIALLVAYHYHKNKSQNGCNAVGLLELAKMFSIGKLISMEVEKIAALMEEMRELNVLQHTGDGRYRFTRHSFCQMMGTVQQIDDELLNYMEN